MLIIFVRHYSGHLFEVTYAYLDRPKRNVSIPLALKRAYEGYSHGSVMLDCLLKWGMNLWPDLHRNKMDNSTGCSNSTLLSLLLSTTLNQIKCVKLSNGYKLDMSIK